ncbi:MAG: hypothetical protein CM1200mP18_15800 [Gammaproteobacteria bacterium]|nr:MAG: hypothetical protein CM1200mP18_15800 [Gammaproteobacteria bacterium]
MEVACQRLSTVAPLIRGRLARTTGDPDRPYRRMVLRPLLTPDILAFLDSEGARNLALLATAYERSPDSDEDSTRMGGRTSL